ncbi:MAG: DNA repair protein RecO [Phycisphaerae bacterium]|nr:DNA repair protein RecO [Phycisphaerae bacterium]
MIKLKEVALCLRAVNYSDTSQVVTLLTREHGKIAAIAKGARRPKSAFDGAIEPFAYGQVMVMISESHDTLSTLTEFVQSGRFRSLRSNLAAMHAGLFALELTEASFEQSDPHPTLFDALVDMLDRLGQYDKMQAVLPVLIDYQLTLLDEAGVAPRLDACTNCGAPTGSGGKDLYFSSAANGLLCGGCEQAFTEKRRLSPACCAMLNRRAAFTAAPPALLTEAEQLLVYHFTELMHRPPKMAKYFVTRANAMS